MGGIIMEIKRISKWVVITGTLVIWLVKFGIRPFYDFERPLEFFFGIAPNLAGSFLIPFAACWFFSGKDFFVAKLFRIHSPYDLRIVCGVGLGMLVVNEYLQLIPFFGRTFDYYDIVFSLVGLAASYFVFMKAQGPVLSRVVPD
jgi:hypothetical protein